MEDIWIEWGSVEIRWRQERQRRRQRQQWKQFPRCNMTINRWRRRWQQHRHEPTPLPLCHPFMTLAVTYHLRLCAYAHMWETFQFRVMGGKRLNQMTISWRRHVCSNLLTTTLMHGMTTTHTIATNNITTEDYIKRVQSTCLASTSTWTSLREHWPQCHNNIQSTNSVSFSTVGNIY